MQLPSIGKLFHMHDVPLRWRLSMAYILQLLGCIIRLQTIEPGWWLTPAILQRTQRAHQTVQSMSQIVQLVMMCMLKLTSSWEGIRQTLYGSAVHGKELDCNVISTQCL